MRPGPTRTSGEPGSFRDPDGRVFYSGNEVYRALSARGLEDFEALEASGLLADSRIVRTARAGDGVLRHEKIPFVSYPYEWTFSMLKDAALLQLDLLLEAVDRDLILKDATPYNVQFAGTRPVFIDVGSFERLQADELWVGYRQFCMLHLYPLLLQATKRASFQPWLRGSLEGIPAAEMRALASFRDRFRRGWFTHVFLAARLEARDGGGSAGLKAELRRQGLGKHVILANVRKMRRFVDRLEWRPTEGVWTSYGEHNTYTDEDAKLKDDFVWRVATSQAWPLVWDLGCNTGRHARIAAERAGQVIALDADQGPVELLYRALRDRGDERILPLTVDLANPSPGLGWRGSERKPLLDRGRPDLVLALALIHHLSIGANVPIVEVVDWLAALGGALVVEFPEREDPMVTKLLARKRHGLHPDYHREHFEHCLVEAFHVERREVLGSGTRVLYFATPRRT